MSRSSGFPVAPRPALLAVVVTLVLASASVAAAADDGPGPLGVTSVAAATERSARVGALFGADRVGDLAGGHFCTASVVHSPRRNLIVTAAHCVAGHDGDLLFVPGYRDGRVPHGVWRVGRPLVPEAWTEGEDEDGDLALAPVDELDGERIEDVVGGNRFTTGAAPGAAAVTVIGYPDSREVPLGCTGEPAAHSRTQQRVDCPDLTAGTSGSPWITGDQRVVGVLGGHERGGSTADVSYSVVLGRAAAGLYREAVAASGA
ncbi:trypsin-like peptidase domain-containing protein [Streptomyces sp. TG1A-8]|uniref:trypsin-like serine peptidase n=1 Tax=Streptomyces sp. TG1A-8 TaxID=3051385 RepID=UPI00265BD1C8|nr:trypsin-like peptidase domain-containing protein [Streptomyces sp. TG1A-8]MDO0927050.1 trypsin-like peptidase domain-containing protein [Streptomyces sp. TG1A-8]